MFLTFVMNTKVVMSKNIALEKIESHEKLCRIMQKQTHQKIHNIEQRSKILKNICTMLCQLL